MSQESDFDSNASVQSLLDLVRIGDRASVEKLLNKSMNRLRELAKRISTNIPGVKRWEQTDDILQNSMLRLWKALEKHHPATPLDYYRLASSIMRRELIDMSRHYFGPEGMGANHARAKTQNGSFDSRFADVQSDDTSEQGKLSDWTEFHEYVESLSDEERALFDLFWYQGLTVAQVAELTGGSERTVRRRWKTVRIALYQKLMAPG